MASRVHHFHPLTSPPATDHRCSTTRRRRPAREGRAVIRIAQGAAHSSGWAAGGLPSSSQRFGDVAEELLARSSPKRARLSPKTALYSLGVLQALVSAGASHSGQDSTGSRTRRKGAYASASAIDASAWHVSAMTAPEAARAWLELQEAPWP